MYGRVLEQRQKKKKMIEAIVSKPQPFRIKFFSTSSAACSRTPNRSPRVNLYFYIQVFFIFFLYQYYYQYYQYISILVLLVLFFWNVPRPARIDTETNRGSPPPRLLCARCLNLSSLSVRRRVKSIESFFSFFFFYATIIYETKKIKPAV